MRASSMLFFVVVLATVAVGAQVNIRPGMYEYTVDLKMVVPKEAEKAVLDAAGFEGQKRRDCISEDEARQAKEDVVKFFAKEMDQQECKMSDVKVTPTSVAFTSTCVDDGMKIVTRNEMTFGPDSFTGVTTMKGDGGLASSGRMTAKRVGDCK